MAYGGGYGEGYGGAVLFIYFEVAFETDPGEDPVWVDLSERFIQFNVNRGRQRELDRFSAGRAQITLTNEDRALDPTYDDSPYWPNVVPMRRCRIRAQHDSTNYYVFSGYIDGWEQQYMPPEGAVCVLTATDAFKYLSNAELLSSAYAETIAAGRPVLWWRLGDPVGSTLAAESVSASLPLEVVGEPTFGTTSLSLHDPDAAVQFTHFDDGLQGVFPEGTFPFGTAASVEFFYRYDDIGSAPPGTFPLAISTIPGSPAVSALQVNLSFGSTELEILAQNAAGTLFTASTLGFNYEDGLGHDIVVSLAAGAQIKVYVDGVDLTDPGSDTFSGTFANTADKWLVASNSFDYPPFSRTGVKSTVDEITLWDRALSPAEVAAHSSAITDAWAGESSGDRVNRLLDTAPWPAADRLIDDGSSTLQGATLGGSVLAYLQKIEETEQGALFVDTAGRVRFLGRGSLLQEPYLTSQATFGDEDPELEYADLTYIYDDQLIYNDVQVTRDGGVTQVVGDPASQARYLRRTKVFDSVLYTSDASARGLAGWFVTHYKEPILRATNLRLEPSAGNESTHFPQVLGRDLMERVTVRRRPQNLGPAIDQEALIEGITHEATAMEWRTTWNLSPAETQIYWLAGIPGYSEAGVTTRAAM